MKQILKHSFEAVSLLSTSNGMLDVTIIPAFNQPDWIIPSSLILSVDECHERVSTYLWQQHEVVVFHLLQEQSPEKMVVLEGNTVTSRLALQTAGELHQLRVRISEVKDIELPEYSIDNTIKNSNDNIEKTADTSTHQPIGVSAADEKGDSVETQIKEDVVLSYLFQTVMIDDTTYLIPDLDRIADQLVDLGS